VKSRFFFRSWVFWSVLSMFCWVPVVHAESGLSKLGEYGFEPEKDSSLPDPNGAKQGIDTIFGGVGFRMYVPEGLFKVLISPDASRQWLVYGNSPSPRSRKLGG
jgi:hypothetical protein